ncbi:MAG: flagellar basal body rod protein FlgB [Nitrospiraceae bacterium]|nr:flagellar basal body rod protein FlgB [Nitrospiraceae bacterium]
MTGAEGLLESLIRFTMERHGVIAGNIANSDTPGYKAMDIKFEDFLSGGALPLTVTNPAHMRAADPGPGLLASVQEDGSAPWKDGNNVEMDKEVARMNENALLFEAGIKLLGNRMSMYSNALKR